MKVESLGSPRANNLLYVEPVSLLILKSNFKENKMYPAPKFKLPAKGRRAGHKREKVKLRKTQHSHKDEVIQNN